MEWFNATWCKQPCATLSNGLRSAKHNGAETIALVAGIKRPKPLLSLTIAAAGLHTRFRVRAFTQTIRR